MSLHDVPAAGVGASVPSQAAVGLTHVRHGASAAGPPQLTARELEVLRLLGDARSTAQIASALAVSTNTVRGHVRTLLRKLAVVGREDAVRCARELGLLPRPNPRGQGVAPTRTKVAGRRRCRGSVRHRHGGGCRPTHQTAGGRDAL